MPRHVPRRSLAAARAAGLFFVRPHRAALPPPPPSPAPPADVDRPPPAEADRWRRTAFDSLGRVTTAVYEAGRLELPSGAISRTWYDPAAPPAPPHSLGAVTTCVYDPAAGTTRREGQGEGPG
jgi:hypothetical protein